MRPDTIQITKEFRGRTIIAELTFLDTGIHVLAAGGDCSHVGAVSMKSKESGLQTLSFPTHRESILTEHWAKTLCSAFCCPVTVAAGIHYDNASPTDIGAILRITDEMLAEFLTHAA